ncbi:hypothetical protein ACTHHL_04605 [Aeribacillus composti]|uniref:hypothetical protein n=1 Tax=Aeribacillus composti TaxID=1868734 RepID=UPI00406A1445
MKSKKFLEDLRKLVIDTDGGKERHYQATLVYLQKNLDALDWLIEQAEKAVISEELLDQQRAINMKIKLKYTKQKQQLKQAQTKAERYEKVLKQIASHELFTESYFCDLEANELIYKAQEALEGLNENAK